MANISIMQPTFLPWLGYFNLIKKSEIFVFLDHVQLDKRSWQQRNKIKANQGELFLTVPLITKNKSQQKISETKIQRQENYISDHLKSIKQNYSKSQYFNQYFDKISDIYYKNFEYLNDLNINFIKYFSKVLKLKKNFFKSSELNIDFKKKNNDLLIDICKKFNVNEYLSPIGSKIYLDNDKFKNNNIEIKFNDFNHPVYNQINKKFLPNLSIIDLVFNEGENSHKFI